MLHSICQQIWTTQQWPQDWKRSVFIPVPKKGNAKECSLAYLPSYVQDLSEALPDSLGWTRFCKGKRISAPSSGPGSGNWEPGNVDIPLWKGTLSLGPLRELQSSLLHEKSPVHAWIPSVFWVKPSDSSSVSRHFICGTAKMILNAQFALCAEETLPAPSSYGTVGWEMLGISAKLMVCVCMLEPPRWEKGERSI